ncbi:Hemolysin [hydrothermal vent metagenome]|uniref:Hemolysin n=1 Tax=hydrothermal vent metagenome TaxID=652676 RepID=A0A1W1D2G4_9ZZZZ
MAATTSTNDANSTNNTTSTNDANSTNNTTSTSNTNDLIIDDNSSEKQVTIKKDTDYDNVKIDNQNGKDDYYAKGNDGVDVTVSDGFNLISTSNGYNSYLQVQNSGSLTTNDVNISQQAYIYGKSADIKIQGKAKLEDNGSIETTNGDITIEQLNTQETSYVAGYENSDITLGEVDLKNDSFVYSENGDINITSSTTANYNTYIYTKNKNITTQNVTLYDDASIGSENGSLDTDDVTLNNNSSLYTKQKDITTNNVTLYDDSNIFAQRSIVIQGDATLQDNSYIDANTSSLTIKGISTLENNASLYAMGGGDLTLQKDTSLKNTARIYTQDANILIKGTTTAQNSSYIYSENGDITTQDITLSDDATIGGANGSITTQNVTLQDNSSLYNKNITTNNVTLSDDSSIFAQETILIKGDVTLQNNSYIDANTSSLTIKGISTLENNASLYAMGAGELYLEDDTSLANTARIYTQDANITLNGTTKEKDDTYIYSENGDITTQDITLSDDAIIKSKNGSLDTNDVTLNNNSSLYAKNITTNNVTLNDDSNILAQRDILVQGDVTLHNNSYIDANTSSLTIEGTSTLENNASLYAMGDKDLQTKKLILRDTARIYTQDANIIINGSVDGNDSSYIYSENGDITTQDITLQQSSNIGTNKGNITANDVTLYDNTSLYTQDENSSITLNNATLSDDSFLYSLGNITIQKNTTLKDNSYISANKLNIYQTINLENNTSLYGSTITLEQNLSLQDDAKIYANNDIIINGSTTAQNSSYIYSENGDITTQDITLNDDATIGGANGSLITQNVTLHNNSSLYEQNITTNNVTLYDDSNIFAQKDILAQGDVALHNNSYIDANTSSLTINGITSLEDNASLYAMGSNNLTLQKDTSLKNTARIYTQDANIIINGNTTAQNSSYIYSKNGDITTQNITLSDDATIGSENGSLIAQNNVTLNDKSSLYANKGIILMKKNEFNGPSAGIIITKTDATGDIVLRDETTLNNGAYIINKGTGKIDINTLNIFTSGYVLGNNDINISTISVTDDGSFDYALINSQNGKLYYQTLSLPESTRLRTFVATREDNNLSIYTKVTEPTDLNLSKDEDALYYSLASSLNNKPNTTLYSLLGTELSDKEFVDAIKTMKPSLAGAFIPTVNILNSSISTIKDHLSLQVDQKFLSSNLWIQTYTTNAKQDDTNNKDGYSLSGKGLILGADKKIRGTNSIYGIALSYGTSTTNSNNNQTNNKIDSTQEQLYLYLATQTKNSYFQAYMAKGIAQNKGQRDIILKDQTKKATSSYDSSLSNFTVTSGLKYKYKNIRINPYSILSSSIITTDTYKEKGAQNLNLEISNKELFKTSLTLGTSLATKFSWTSNHIFVPEIKYGYRKDFGDESAKATAKFEDADSSFITNGVKMDDTLSTYGFTLKYFNKNFLLSGRIDFNTIKSKHFQSNTTSFSIRYLFH